VQTSIPDYAKTLPADHPVRIYLEENLFLKDLLFQLAKVDVLTNYQLAYNLFNQIATVDVRYTRKENQLFPYLEKRGWFGPSQGMWQFHDNNRKLIKDVRAKLESGHLADVKPDIDLMISELYRMTQVEEGRLFPNALELLLPEDWVAMKVGESEIGWMHKKNQPKQEHEVMGAGHEGIVFPEGLLKMNEGRMTLDQINLMLQVIPFDLTYVDENDKVLFYNRGEERVFPRSAGVIGREVRFCHPPKSVATVLEILEEFRAGRKSVAEFWINYRGKVIHIRYFAVRDQNQNYKGVIEVSQDVTEIKKLEGEKRLLDWSH
jgi:PAS domain S-box-containing protein